MRCDFVGPESTLWSQFLADCQHDFYHLPQYGVLSTQDRLSAPEANGAALAFHAADEDGHRFLMTLIVRPLLNTGGSSISLFDAITPYGYACPLLIRSGDSPIDAFLVNAIAEFSEGLKQRGIVSVFARTHPLIPFPMEPLRKTGCVVDHCDTVYIDLSLPQTELWHQTRADHRSGINRARKSGFVVEFQDDWKDFDEFFRAYTETMKRVSANSNYFFSRDYFLELRESIGDKLHLAICKKDGAVACAGLFTEVCGIVQFHLSGTTDEFYSQFPTKIMLDSVRTWAKERGNQTMHLGGGYSGTEDSLFLFKAGFSHLRAPFHTWRMISNPEAYQALCRQWEARTGKTASAPDGFFPAYRAP